MTTASRPERAATQETTVATTPSGVTGRLGVLTITSLLLGAVPLPIVPGRVLRQIRGAVAHDALARQGVSLVTDARVVLAEPNSTDRMRTLLRKGVEYASRRLLRRLGPLAVLSAAASAVELFALGHLLERYVLQVRPRGSVRMLEPEARRIRRAIDAAVVRALSPNLHARQLTLGDAPEDLRDELTRWLDTLILTGASLPSYIERRLDAAFAEVVAESPDLRQGDD